MREQQTNGLDQSTLDHIIEIILSHKAVDKIVIFGSRATDSFKRVSDIDIAIFSKNWTSTDINLAKDKLEENIKTPLKFDVVNFYSLAKDMIKKNILEHGRTIYEPGKD